MEQVNMSGICLVWLVCINLLAFLMYGFDKWRAVRDGWRIPEARLLAVAVLGGSVGAYLGMKIFRHKTRKNKFRVGIPVIFAAQVILAGMIFRALN